MAGPATCRLSPATRGRQWVSLARASTELIAEQHSRILDVASKALHQVQPEVAKIAVFHGCRGMAAFRRRLGKWDPRYRRLATHNDGTQEWLPFTECDVVLFQV